VIFTLNYLLLAGIAIGLGFLVGKGTHFLKITGVVGYIVKGVNIGLEGYSILTNSR
jgi:Kef-type K+ transport system membrane component KefB